MSTTDNTASEVIIPQGFRGLLEEFTYRVLKEQPTDLVDFSCNYFLNKKQNGGVATANKTSSEAEKTENDMDQRVQSPASGHQEESEFASSSLCFTTQLWESYGAKWGSIDRPI